MVKRHINTIFGVICAIIIIIVASVVSRQPCPTKDTAGSANADPQATQNKTLPPQATNKCNNQLSGAFTGTSRTPSSRHHPHHGDAAPSSDAGATLLVAKPGNGTNNAEGSVA
eukprot:11375321-Ditylum_brightwellii.AAC.1